MSRMILVSAAALLVVVGAARSQPAGAPYCENLKQLILLAASREKFASIAAKPREGNFSDTSLALTGWSDCSVYGSRTYTCDFQTMKSAEEAEDAQSKIVQEIKTCLDNTWTEDKDRSSSVFVVLHHPIGFVSMTVSTDEKANDQHTVRLIIFFRSTP